MIANHLGHQETWYNKGNPTDGLVGPDGRGIIVCGACNERLYYGTLEPSNEILTNRTIDQIYGTLKEGSTVAAKDNNINEESLKVVPPGEWVAPGSASMEIKDTTEVQSSYTITAHYSRTIKDPSASFGSITCGIDVAEVMPGTLDMPTLQELAKDQFIGIKALVLNQLGLQFSIDEETNNIMEIFPESQLFGQVRQDPQARPIAPYSDPEPAPEPIKAPAASRPASPAPRATQGRTGPREGAHGPQTRGANTGAGGRRAAATIPDNDALWYELVQDPGQWYWNNDKVNARQSDFLSLTHYKDDGWPVGLWLTNQKGENITPNDPDWQADFDAIPEDAFAQDRPRKRD